MSRTTRLFLLLTLIGPLHMGEQMLTGIDEFYSIRSLVDGYYGWFAPSSADVATVGLITIGWTACSLVIFACLYGGRARTAVLAMFGVFGVTELHHVVEALQKGAYDPGMVTCFPYAYVGWLLLRAAWDERGASTATPIAGRVTAMPGAA